MARQQGDTSGREGAAQPGSTADGGGHGALWMQRMQAVEHERDMVVKCTEDFLTLIERTLARVQGQQGVAARRWCVRSATEEKSLEGTLNVLTEAGWQIYVIFEARVGGYRVVAWREEATKP